MTPGQRRAAAAIEAELARLIRYDDESVVHEAWIRQRYQGGFAASYVPARSAAVQTAWHEAGHAVAALAVGARFSSASIRAGGSTSGRVHSIQGGGDLSFVIAAAGQVAERLRDWTLPESGRDLSRWLAGWPGGGAARTERTTRFWPPSTPTAARRPRSCGSAATATTSCSPPSRGVASTATCSATRGS